MKYEHSNYEVQKQTGPRSVFFFFFFFQYSIMIRSYRNWLEVTFFLSAPFPLFGSDEVDEVEKNLEGTGCSKFEDVKSWSNISLHIR
jgi:hypothetical protein